MLLETAGKFLLTGYQFMTAMHLRQPDNIYIVIVYHLQKRKKEYKVSKKQHI